MGFFDKLFGGKAASETKFSGQKMTVCLLYTSDAADEL